MKMDWKGQAGNEADASRSAIDYIPQVIDIQTLASRQWKYPFAPKPHSGGSIASEAKCLLCLSQLTSLFQDDLTHLDYGPNRTR